MKALWLSALLMLGCSLVIAQVCNVDRSRTVPQLCVSSLETRFSPRRLNFTILNESKLSFEPLPENRQVDIEVDENSDGLESWANLANAFVDSVRSGSLPYDVIIPYLRSSVDSPIASQCESTRTSNDADGDASISDLLSDFGDWWTPILVVTFLGPVFAVIFIVVGTCFCCCRLCGKCGGDLQQDHRDNNDIRCVVLYIILVCCVCLLFVGVVFAFVSNEKVNDSIRNINTTVNTAVDNSLNFVDDTQREANITVDRYDEINALVECEINNTHISIGGTVIDVFEPAVEDLISTSLELATELNTSIDALEQVNATVVDLLELTQRLQTELNNITDQTVALNMSCRAAASNNSALTTFCNMIPNTSYNVIVDFSAVQDVSTVITALKQVGDISARAIEANDSFYAIPCDIRDQVRDQTREILDVASDFRETIANITADIERELDDILDEDGFVGDLRSGSSDIQDSVDQYDTPRYAVSIVLCSLTLVVIVLLIFGLVLGTIGFRKGIEPEERSTFSNLGGIALLIAVGLMFVFAVILLFLSSITFFMGANMLKVCYSIAEDPPNDLPSYELFSEIIDDSELWGGYLLGCFVLDDSRIPLTVTSMLDGCRDNGPLYRVARLSQRESLNLENVTNISSQIPNLDGLFEDLEQEVMFDRDQILTQDTIESLQDYANSGLQGIDYDGYIAQTRASISNLNASGLISTLEMVRDGFNRTGQSALAAQTSMIIATIQSVNDTTITEIATRTDALEAQILMLNNTASQLNDSVNGVIEAADETFDALQNSSIVIDQSRAVLDRIIAYADSYANWAIDNLEDQIGRCRPLYATYSNLYFDVCEDAVDGINGFWLAIGWCVLFFIPTIVFAVWLSHYFRRMREWNSTVQPYDSDSYPMKNIK